MSAVWRLGYACKRGLAASVWRVSEVCRIPAGEPCPACGQADLRPYGNGSKWICPDCFFLLPCCEGGEQPAARAGTGT
jgi:hypothetical protein